jgi:hypothetical protein
VALPNSCCYYGTGAVKLAPWDAWQQAYGYHYGLSYGIADPLLSDAFRDVGEANRLDLDVRTRKHTLQRYDGCGGTQCATEQLDTIELTLGLDCLDWDNLELAFAATRTDIAVEAAGQAYGYGYGYNYGVDIASLPRGTPMARLAMLTKCARKPMAILFEGRNAVDDTSIWTFIPKVKLHIAPSRRFISDDIAELTLTGTVLHAGERGQGYSPWWDEYYGT